MTSQVLNSKATSQNRVGGGRASSAVESISDSTVVEDSGGAESNPFTDTDKMFARLGKDNIEDIDDDDEETFEDARVPQTFELELVSVDAQMAWFGKPRTADDRGFPGIEWFVRRSGKLCRFVRDDDPYAMRSALEIEQLLGDMHTNLNTFLSETSQLLESAREDGLTFTGVTKDRYEKQTVGLEPKNGYALAAARLVGRYDRMVLDSHLCRDMSHLTTKRFKEMKNRKHFRALTWMLQTALRGTSGATREDFRNSTANARDAFDKHGELPEEILDPNFELTLMEVNGPANEKVKTDKEESERQE